MNRWQELKSEGTFFWRAGHAAPAIERLTQAMELARPVPGLSVHTNHMLNYLAHIYLSEGMLAEAERTIREAIRHETEAKLEPSGANRMILANVLHQQGRCKEAVRAGKEALAIHRNELGWGGDFARQTKKIVASFKKPPVAKTETQKAVGLTA